MQCADPEQMQAGGFFPRLVRKAEAAGVPISGTFDLTWRCCFRCLHCYAGPARDRRGELTTAEALDLLDQMAAAGCLDLLFSGGDPLLRRDFERIYRHARECGMFLKVFTNAALVSERIADLFADYAPDYVEVSLYAATDATAAIVTGDPQGLRRTLRGIDRLRRRGVRVRLKSVLMATNAAEFPAIEALATSLGLPFRMDVAILPRLNGDMAPLALRVPAEEAVRIEFSDPERRQKWARYLEQLRKMPPTNARFVCKAGRTDFHLDPYGILRPCVMFPGGGSNARVLSFSEAWRQVSTLVKKATIAVDVSCRSCNNNALSGSCSAVAELETGFADRCSGYLCDLGRERADLVGSQ